MKIRYLIFTLLLPITLFAQNNLDSTISQNKDFNSFKVSFALAHVYIPSHHLHEESESSQLIPTDGLDIQYNFNHKYFIKWTNEIEFLSYNLKNHDGEKRVRENAFLSIVTFGYEFYSKLAFIAGAGYEFEKSKNLWVTRLGTEYTFSIGDNWELSPELLYDIKKDSHTAITWGFGIGYRF